MVTRRALLSRGAALLAAGSLGGCTDILGESARQSATTQWFPTTTTFSEYGQTIDEHGYTAWRVDAESIREHRDAMSEAAYEPFTRPFSDPGVPGVSPGDVTTQVLGGTGAINALPSWRLGRLGQMAYVVTLGDFDRSQVVEALADEGLERGDRGELPRFTGEGASWLVDDGWVVGGLEPFVPAVVAAYRDGENRLAESDEGFARVLSELDATTFSYATSHENYSPNVLDEGRLEGQTAGGVGYEFTEDGPRLRAVLVFSEESLVDRSAVAERAAEGFENVGDPEVTTDGRVVEIRGQIDTFELAFTNAAFVPFA